MHVIPLKKQVTFIASSFLPPRDPAHFYLPVKFYHFSSALGAPSTHPSILKLVLHWLPNPCTGVALLTSLRTLSSSGSLLPTTSMWVPKKVLGLAIFPYYILFLCNLIISMASVVNSIKLSPQTQSRTHPSFTAPDIHTIGGGCPLSKCLCWDASQ